MTASAERSQPFEQYLTEVRRIPLLSREEERDLARAYRQTGDRRAAQRLVTSNLRFVVRIAREHCSDLRRLADLVQEGNLGLMQAVERFDPDKDVRLISYATTWIRSRILNHILHTWSLVKLGTTSAQRRLFFSLTRKEKELSRQLDPSDDEAVTKVVPMLARCFGVEPRVIDEMRRRLDRRDVSLDASPNGNDESGISALPSGDAGQDDLLAMAEENAIDCRRVRAALGCLDERERLVIDLRIMTEPPLTLQAVGEKLGCGRERARQLEARATRKLRDCLDGRVRQDECPGSRLVVLGRRRGVPSTRSDGAAQFATKQ